MDPRRLKNDFDYICDWSLRLHNRENRTKAEMESAQNAAGDGSGTS